MKHLFSILAFLLLVFTACKTSKETTSSTKVSDDAEKKWVMPSTEPIPAKRDDRNSLLWEISGNGLEQPSYLFGTIHLIGEEDFFFTELMQDRFERTGQLTLEIDMDNPAMMMGAMGGMFIPDGKSLKDIYAEDEYEIVKTYFEDSLGMSMLMMDRMKPILLTTLMMEQGGEKEQLVSYEAVLMEKAQRVNKEILGLETAEYQMSMLDSIPIEEQAKMLLEQITDPSKDVDGVFEKMLDVYKQQNIDELYSMTIESEEMGGYEGPLLITRNKNWIAVIDKMSQDMPTFFGLGAAHLGGEYGVINLLQEAGFTLTPLKMQD